MPDEPLSLACYSTRFDDAFLRYISFLKERRRSGSYMAHVCHTAVRHLHFLKASSPPYSAAQERLLQRQLENLDSLKYQLRKITHHAPFDYGALMARAGYNNASDVMARIEEEKREAIRLMKVSRGGVRGRSAGGREGRSGGWLAAGG
jgi:hypothetical protein